MKWSKYAYFEPKKVVGEPGFEPGTSWSQILS